MVESKVVSVRVPSEMLEALDRIAMEKYPPRRSSNEPNRSMVLLDALEAYLNPDVHSVNDVDSIETVDNVYSVNLEARITALTEERLQSELGAIRQELAAMEDALKECKTL